MSIIHLESPIVNPGYFAEVLVDDGSPAPSPATLETSEWIDTQASYYRSLGNDLADVVAETLESLARDWRVASCGRPISVDTFRARMELMAEFASETLV